VQPSQPPPAPDDGTWDIRSNFGVATDARGASKVLLQFVAKFATTETANGLVTVNFAFDPTNADQFGQTIANGIATVAAAARERNRQLGIGGLILPNMQQIIKTQQNGHKEP